MDYDPFLGLADVDYLFRTSRGSTYAKHTDNTTTRNRSGEKHRDTSVGLQQRSGKTIFVPSEGVDDLGRIFQNQNIATQIVPLSYDQKTKSGTVAVKALEDGTNMWTGPFKKGQVLAQSTFTTIPQVGLAPVEINRSESLKGDTGKGVHFGTQITEVNPRASFKTPAPSVDNDVIDAVFPSDKRRAAGKAGIAAALAGGAGAASAGDLRRAAGDVVESFLPLGITPSTLAPGTLTPEQRAASDAATQRKRQQEAAAKMKAQALLRTGVPMPEEYRKGGRVRMI